MQQQLRIAISTVKAWKAAKSSMFLDSTPQKRTLEEPMREATWQIKGRGYDKDGQLPCWLMGTQKKDGGSVQCAKSLPGCTLQVLVGSDGGWKSLQTTHTVPAAQTSACHQKHTAPLSSVSRSTSHRGRRPAMGTRLEETSASRGEHHTGWRDVAESSRAPWNYLAGSQREDH